MPTQITEYFLSRPDGTSTTDVTICGVDPYFQYLGFQTYVDEALVFETGDYQWTCEIPVNKKVDILAIDEYEVGQDLSDYLDDSHGDKVAFLLPKALIGLSLRFFTDNGTGTIDYSTPIFDIDTTGLPVQDNAFPTLTIAEYELLILEELSTMTLSGLGDGFARIVFTDRLLSGTYKFGVKSYNDAIESSPLEFTQTIVTRPDELTPKIVSYDQWTDTLVLSAGRNDAGATYHVYSGMWNGSECSIDYIHPIATSSSPTVTVVGLRGSMTSGFVYVAMRETQNGQEEQNFNIVTLTVAASNWTVNQPAAPFDLTGQIQSGNEVLLTWQFDPFAPNPTPTGFDIYSDGGTGIMNYTTPIWSLAYHRKINNFAFVGPISVTTKFGVRTFIGDEYGTDTSENLDTVSVSPLSSPTDPDGEMEPTWVDRGTIDFGDLS